MYKQFKVLFSLKFATFELFIVEIFHFKSFIFAYAIVYVEKEFSFKSQVLGLTDMFF